MILVTPCLQDISYLPYQSTVVKDLYWPLGGSRFECSELKITLQQSGSRYAHYRPEVEVSGKQLFQQYFSELLATICCLVSTQVTKVRLTIEFDMSTVVSCAAIDHAPTNKPSVVRILVARLADFLPLSHPASTGPPTQRHPGRRRPVDSGVRHRPRR